MSKSLLIITFEFAPINVGGTMRPLLFSNYFVEQGYDVNVLTVDPKYYTQIDEGLIERLDKRVKVTTVELEKQRFYSKLINSGYGYAPEDRHLRWKKKVYENIDRIFLENKPDFVIITLPPFSIFKSLEYIKSKYQTFVLLDFRDAWTQWVLTPYASKVHYQLKLQQENKALLLADSILVTSPVTLNDLKRLHPKIDKNKFHFIPNSFPSELKENLIIPNFESAEKIRITYIGNFYYKEEFQALFSKPWYKKKPYQWFQYLPRREDWKYRSPYFIFKTFDTFFKSYPNFKNKIELHFVGNIPDWWDSFLSEFDLNDNVFAHGYLSKSKTNDFLKLSDILLLTSNKVISGEDYSIAGKTYEYFESGKPIFGFVCEGSQKWILEESGISLIFNPDQPEKNSHILADFFQNRIILKQKIDFLKNFQTKNTLYKLNQIFDDLIKSSKI